MARIRHKKTTRQVAPDPHPGIGGYTGAMRPGFRGSTSANRENPDLKQRWAGGRSARVPVAAQQAELKQDPREFYGGSPYMGQAAELTVNETGLNPPHSRDAEQITRPMISGRSAYKGTRNSRHYTGDKARPEDMAEDGSGSPRRFVYRGGGVETYQFERPMPYDDHGTVRIATEARPDGVLVRVPYHRRGSVLDGQRLFMEPVASKYGGLGNQGGQIGITRKRGSRHHRPTVFAEPAPHTARYYDTTRATGTPASPGSVAQPDLVHVSPDINPDRTRARRGWR